MPQRKPVDGKKDFYINLLLRIGIYKAAGKQLYELNLRELHTLFLKYYFE
jgi:hypothetical protein